MANMFNVGDSVVCQKKGGQSGTKALTPAFPGQVLEVLPGGEKYRVKLGFPGGLTHTAYAHFKNGIVEEASMTSA